MLSATITHPWGGRTTLGGGCGSRTYSNVGANTIQAIIAGLQQGGATVTGNNPWTIDTHQSSVMLRGTWDANAQTITVEVTDSAFWAPCGSIWIPSTVISNPSSPRIRQHRRWSHRRHRRGSHPNSNRSRTRLSTRAIQVVVPSTTSSTSFGSSRARMIETRSHFVRARSQQRLHLEK